MGVEENMALVKETAEAVGAVLEKVPLYQDAVQPAAQEVGKALATPLQLLNAALRPVRTIILGVNLAYDRLDARLQELFKDTPADKVKEPPPAIAGPLLVHYPFVESEESLREMFEQLLFSAMHADRQADAHPSFVEVIKQLSPDEARLVRYLWTSRRADWPIMQSSYIHPEQPGFRKGPLLSMFTREVALQRSDRVVEMIDNLIRLRIVDIPALGRIASEEEYEPIRSLPEVSILRDFASEAGCTLDLTPQVLLLTPFGERFMSTCIGLGFRILQSAPMA